MSQSGVRQGIVSWPGVLGGGEICFGSCILDACGLPELCGLHDGDDALMHACMRCRDVSSGPLDGTRCTTQQ